MEVEERLREEEMLGTTEKKEKRKVEDEVRVREEGRLGTKEKRRGKWRLCRG